MPLINSIFTWLIKKRVHQIELFKKHPVEVQQEWLKRLVESGKGTEWGKMHHYRDITSLERFKEYIPLQDYNSLKPYIIRMKHGEKNLLWPGEVKWFAKSSGTTSDVSKFIPVTKEAIDECHYKGGKDLLALYYNQRPESTMFMGKTLIVGGSAQINHFSADSYYGDLSSIIIKNLPMWVELRRVPELSIALMAKWEEKIERMAAETAKEDVTNISGVPSWTLKLLNRILEITGKSNIHDVWPNLELFMHGGVDFRPYKQQFLDITSPGKLNFLETYNASEGFFGIQESLEDNDMLLMLDYGIFYEFIPLADAGNPQPKTIELEEVQVGEQYEVVISTNAGLWRYRIGDVVEFTALHPYRIRVVGRTKHYINAFGEEVIIDNAEFALSKACRETNAAITDYTAAPKYMKNGDAGAHEWLIEFEKMPSSMDAFVVTLDNSLREVNSDYDAKRSGNLILQKPTVHPVPTGTFYNWLKQKNKLGGQYKIPRLLNDRSIVDTILKME